MDENYSRRGTYYPRRDNYYSRRGYSTAYERDTRSWKRKREVCTPVAPAQTVDQRPATNVQDDPYKDKNKKGVHAPGGMCSLTACARAPARC